MLLSLLLTLLLTPQGDARLSVAAMNGNAATVKALIEQKADVNAPQGDGTTALHWAAYRDDVEMTRVLIAAGANVAVKTRLGEMTPLFMAAKNGNAPVIDLLLKAGADPKSATTTGTTPLMLAAASGSVEAVKLLIAAGVDVNARDLNQGQTALMFAAAPGRAEVIKVLAAAGADVNASSLVPDPRQQEGAGGPKWRKGELALGGLAALHFAVRDGQTAAVKALLDAKANVNQPTASNGMSALTIAILNGHFDLAKMLLQNGADPKPSSKDGLSALYAVIDAQWANRVWYPAPTTDEQQTTHLELIKEILARGADPNARLGQKLWQREFHGDWIDPSGATAFWRAAQANDLPAMKLLIAGGANPNIPSNEGVSPLGVATGFGFEPQVSTFVPDSRLAVVRYLVEELAADVNHKDNDGFTPLHGAGLTADNAVITYLVAMGADVDARANIIFGGAEDPNQKVAPGTGDTVADMANGPKPHNLVHPETVALLEMLGSENSDNCRASTCVNRAKKDAAKPARRQ